MALPDIHSLLGKHMDLTAKCRRLLEQGKAALDASRVSEARRLVRLAEEVCGQLRVIERGSSG